MTLEEFISNFICKNTIIRLWEPIENTSNYKLLYKENNKDTCMEWQISKNETWQSKYKSCLVIGITDILTESCVEAVNIVIQT